MTALFCGHQSPAQFCWGTQNRSCSVLSPGNAGKQTQPWFSQQKEVKQGILLELQIAKIG